MGPTDTPKKPKGRSLAEFQPLRPAEKKLLAGCAAGEIAQIGDGRPSEKTDANSIRADFLRFLALGGDEQAPVHEHGVQLHGAWIEGSLDLEAARVPSNLTLSNCHFDTVPVFRDARIAGTLNLDGCEMPGLEGNRLVCEGSVFLRTGFVATGLVNLHSARIRNNLDCSNADFSFGTGISLCAQSAIIQGGVFLTKEFNALGEVQLLNINIDGDLDCGGATFKVTDDADRPALTVERAAIKGNVFFNNGFTVLGQASLLGTQIGGDLDCRNATAENPATTCKPCRKALIVVRAKIAGNVFFNDFSAAGEVTLVGAHIHGNIACIGARFGNEKGDSLAAEGMAVGGALFFRDLSQPVSGVNLASCHVGQLVDDEKSWGENIILDGFTYDHIAGSAPTDAATRLDWLAKQSNAHHGTSNDGADFKPQPWQQLIHVLRAMGHEEDARQVAIAREKHLRKINRIGQLPKECIWPLARLYRATAVFFHRLFGLLADYGYRPLKLFFWMLLVWVLAGASYWAAAQHGIFSPSNPLVFNHPAYAHCRPDYVPEAPQSGSPRRSAPRDDAVAMPKHGNWFTCPELANEYTGFNPMIYSLDLILPLVDLQQEHDWAPIIPTPSDTWYEELFCNWGLTHFTRWLVWFEILFGWIASLLLVAVLTGLTNRDKD